jgi:hypothetical protein
MVPMEYRGRKQNDAAAWGWKMPLVMVERLGWRWGTENEMEEEIDEENQGEVEEKRSCSK